jgi:hypothetical protein
MAPSTKFILCVDHGGHPEALEPRKFYRLVSDPTAAAEGMRRVIDESGEDYLYPAACFVELPLPSSVEAQLETA